MIKILPLRYVESNMLHVGQPVIVKNMEKNLIGHITNIIVNEQQHCDIDICCNLLIDRNNSIKDIQDYLYYWNLTGMTLTSCFVGKCKVYNKLYERNKLYFHRDVVYLQNIINNIFDFDKSIIKSIIR